MYLLAHVLRHIFNVSLPYEVGECLLWARPRVHVVASWKGKVACLQLLGCTTGFCSNLHASPHQAEDEQCRPHQSFVHTPACYHTTPELCTEELTERHFLLGWDCWQAATWLQSICSLGAFQG